MHKVHLLAPIFSLIASAFIWHEQRHQHYHIPQTCGIESIIMFHTANTVLVCYWKQLPTYQQQNLNTNIHRKNVINQNWLY